MKTKVAIVGYGNLGKAIYNNITQSDEFELVGIFSRRQLPNVLHISKLSEYKDKIDLIFLCMGSKTDLEQYGEKLIKDFNIVDSYDNHNKLKTYIKKVDAIAKQNNKTYICSVGWDPGLFSYMRCLIYCLGLTPHTFWGKGLSQGHTQAIKNIKGVKDGLQFTIPNAVALNNIKTGKQNKLPLHNRVCYVVANKQDMARIKNEIVTMPDYFFGYDTKVHFVSQEKLNSLKNYSHKGCVLSTGNIINFSLSLSSNPDFNASIMIAYSRAIKYISQHGKYGAYTILDIPAKYILRDKEDKFKFL